MSDNLNSQQFGNVNCLDCGKPLENGNTHIHLSQEDVAGYKAIYAAAQAHHEKDRIAHYKPFNLKDTAALREHLKSSGHYMHAESVDNTGHEDLLAAHEDDHANMDMGPADEREHHTTLSGHHKHVEQA